MTRAFDKIMAGLDDARAYLNGDRTGFRTGGRDRESTNVMNPLFAELVTPLEVTCRKLLAMSPVEASRVPKDTPVGGVYLFSEGTKHLYVGRTKRPLRERIRNQFGANPSAASFPWLIAREATNRRATYKRNGSRKELLEDPGFRTAYDDARTRIRKMRVRYVHEPEPLRQALLEIYVAVITGAKYNNFDTH